MNIRTSTFDRLVRARQSFVLAAKECDAANDRCACLVRECECRKADRAYEAAAADRAACEASWIEFCAAFGGE
jgi:hypothetical protein